jgi:hypothetical protein
MYYGQTTIDVNVSSAKDISLFIALGPKGY